MGNSSQICKSDTRINTNFDGDASTGNADKGKNAGFSNVIKVAKQLAREKDSDVLIYPSRTNNSSGNPNEIAENLRVLNIPSESNEEQGISTVRNIVKATTDNENSPSENRFPMEKIKRGITSSPEVSRSKGGDHNINASPLGKGPLGAQELLQKASLSENDSRQYLTSAKSQNSQNSRENFLSPQRESEGKSSFSLSDYQYRTPGGKSSLEKRAESTNAKRSTEASGNKHLESFDSNRMEWLNSLSKIREDESNFLKQHNEFIDKALNRMKEREISSSKRANSMFPSANPNGAFHQQSTDPFTSNNIQKIAFNPYTDSMVRTELLMKGNVPRNSPDLKSKTQGSSSSEKTTAQKPAKGEANDVLRADPLENELKRIDDILRHSKSRLSKLDKETLAAESKPRMISSSENKASQPLETLSSPYFKYQEDDHKIRNNFFARPMEESSDKAFINYGKEEDAEVRQSNFIPTLGAECDLASSSEKRAGFILNNAISSEEEILKEFQVEGPGNINRPYENKEIAVNRSEATSELFRGVKADKGMILNNSDEDFLEIDENKGSDGHQNIKKELEEIYKVKATANIRSPEFVNRGLAGQEFNYESNLPEGPSLWKKTPKVTFVEEVVRKKSPAIDDPPLRNSKGDLSNYFKYLLIFYILLTILFSIYKVGMWFLGDAEGNRAAEVLKGN